MVTKKKVKKEPSFLDPVDDDLPAYVPEKKSQKPIPRKRYNGTDFE